MKSIIVVMFYESQFGYEERKLFKSFSSTELFEKYCIDNDIKIMHGAFGTHYYDDVYTYEPKNMELIE